MTMKGQDMENAYSMEKLIGMLEDVISDAKHVPFAKGSIVDVDKLDEIAQRMRLSLPGEIKQAQSVVADKNKIINNAKKEAEDIIRSAESRRNELLNQNELMKEARRRATETLSEAQTNANKIMGDAQKTAADMKTGTNTFVDNMLVQIEELLKSDLSSLMLLRKSINSMGDVRKPPTPPSAPGSEG